MSQKQAARGIIRKDNAILAMKRNKFGMHYYVLIGGGVDVGEDTETALRREIREETCLNVGQVKLVFIEDAGDMYGKQYIYTCEYLGGEPVLSDGCEERAISALEQNTYEPVWLPIADLSTVTFRSSSVRDAILVGMSSGFPETPQTLAWKA